MPKSKPFELKINVRELFNGKILCGWTETDKDVIGYDLVVRQGCDDLAKIPFTKMSNNFEIALFDSDTEIPTNLLKYSSKPNVARFEDDNEVLLVFIYKIRKKDGIVGYERRMDEFGKQDIPVYMINPQYPNQATAHVAFKAVVLSKSTKYVPMTKLKLYKGVKSSPVWLTQSAFYGTCHVSASNGIQLMDLEFLLSDYEKNADRNPRDLESMLVEFGKMVTSELKLIYRNDTQTERPNVFTDSGDSMLEISHFGDCEDFAHFYMRMFRLAMWTYGLNFTPSQKLFQLWEKFAESYVPMGLICKVATNGKIEYHSTLVMVPQDRSVPFISFEVTNPDLTITLDNNPENIKKYKSFHLEDYFLVDNYFVYRIEEPVHEITIQSMLQNPDRLRNY
jgi:hypothetical protein